MKLVLQPIQKAAFALILVFMTVLNASAATRTSTATGGVWSATGTWVGNVAPVAGDDVVIATTGANSVTIGANTTCRSLTINSAATLTFSGNSTLTVSITTSVSGTFTLAGTGTKTFTGDVTINTGGVWNETGVAAINFGGNLINNATTFTANTGVHTFTGATKTINGSTATAIPNLTINGTTTNSGTLTVATALAGSSTLTNSSTGVITIGGTSAPTITNNGTITSSGSGVISSAITNNLVFNMNSTGNVTGTFTNGALGLLSISATPTVPTFTNLNCSAVGNVVNYNGLGNQTIILAQYHSIIISGTGTKTVTLPVDATLPGNLSVVYGSILNIGGNQNFGVTGTTEITGTLILSGTGTKTFTGDVTLSVGGVWAETAVVTVNFGGNLILNSATYTANTGVHNFTGSGKTISGSSTTSFGIVSIDSGASYTLNTNVICSNLTFDAASVNSSLTLNTGISLTVNGAVTINQPTVDSRNSSLNINAGTATVSGGITFAGTNTTASRVGKIAITTGTLNANGGMTFVGSVAGSKVIDMSGGAGNLNLKGALTVPAASSTLISGTTSTFSYVDSAAQTINFFSIGGYNNLAINNTHASGAVLSAAITATNVKGNLLVGNVTTGSLFANGGFGIALAATKNFSVLASSTATISGSGAIAVAVANVLNTGTLNLNGTGTIAGITNNAGGIVNLASSGTITSFNNATSSSTLNISDLTVPTITTFSATAAGNTVNYNGNGAQTVIPVNYSNLNLSGGNTKTFGTRIIKENILSIVSGTNVNLTDGLVHECKGLLLGGVYQPIASYGGTGSTGTTINTTYFTASTGRIVNNCEGIVITTQPLTPTATCNGIGTQTMTVVATGPGLTYSWRKGGVTLSNGTVVSGQGTVTLTLTNPTNANAGIYDVLISSSCGPSLASTARLVSIINETVWTGATNTSWTTVSNWSSCGVPTATSNVTINTGTNQPIITSTVAINSLTIASGASMTVNAGNNLTVTNAIANAGTLTIKSNANLIQTINVANSGAGITNVERASSSLFRLDYTLWCSPVTGTQTLGGFSPLTTASRFYNYDTDSNSYSSVYNTNTFGLAQGILIRMPNNWVDYIVSPPSTPLSWTGTFSGTPNNGNITFGMSTVGGAFNAVGNPYPSTLNIDNFINGNLSNISGTLYFWRKRNDATNLTSYSTCTTAGCSLANSHTYPDVNSISVGQGFIVKATSANLIFNNSMRVASTTNQFFKTKQLEKNRIWVNLSADSTPISQMLVAYMPDATIGVDPGIDGAYINDSQTALNSLIGDEEYVIQGRALPFDGTDVLPLAFKTTTDGNFTIAIDHVDGLFSGSQDIILRDNTAGTETDLKAGPYTFVASAGVDNARFSLKYQKSLKAEVPIFSENSVTIYKNKGVLYVNSGAVAMTNIKVFDLQGRLIAEQKNVKANMATINNLKAINQVLIVNVTSEDNKVVSKKVVN